MDGFEEEDPTIAVEQLRSKKDELEAVARKLGLYLNSAAIVPLPPDGTKVGLIADFLIGDVAFTQRIQDPEQEQIDRMFYDMTSGIGNDDFLDKQAQVKKNVAEGRHPFDNGDKS